MKQNREPFRAAALHGRPAFVVARHRRDGTLAGVTRAQAGLSFRCMLSSYSASSSRMTLRILARTASGRVGHALMTVSRSGSDRSPLQRALQRAPVGLGSVVVLQGVTSVGCVLVRQALWPAELTARGLAGPCHQLTPGALRCQQRQLRWPRRHGPEPIGHSTFSRQTRRILPFRKCIDHWPAPR